MSPRDQGSPADKGKGKARDKGKGKERARPEDDDKRNWVSDSSEDTSFDAQLKKHEARNWDARSTASMQKACKKFYPREGDSRGAEIKYVTARTSLTSEGDNDRIENERAAVTQDNADAARDRRKAGIAHKDFAYPEDYVLREGYRTAKNRREDVTWTKRSKKGGPSNAKRRDDSDPGEGPSSRRPK